MSDPSPATWRLSPRSPGDVTISVFAPDGKLASEHEVLFAVGACMVYGEALARIAADFGAECSDPKCDFCGGEIRCRNCGMLPGNGCEAACPGLMARRALGLA